MDKKIEKYLTTEKVSFKQIKHRKVYTAFNAAETQHINPKEVVKTVLVKLNKRIALWEDDPSDLALVAVPAGKHLDFKKIEKFIFDMETKLYKQQSKTNPKAAKPVKVKVSIAKEKDIAAKLKTKYLLAPLPVYGLPVLLDKTLEKNKSLIFTAGSFTESVKVATKQYSKAVMPITGSFSK